MDTQSIKYHQSVFEAQIDKSTVEATREITFVIASESTGKNHRNKFMYDWSNWNLDAFNSNPIVGYQHNVYGDNMCSAPNPDDVIAKATAWMDTFKGSKVLMSKATFEPAELNATADKVFRKIIFGSLNSSSTGIISTGPTKTEYTKNDKGIVTDYSINFPGQTLVEWSVVNIPADPSALKRSLKSHTFSALSFIQRYVPELSMNDLRGMKVQDILDLVDSKQSGADIEEVERTLSKGPDPDLVNMQEYFKQIKK